MFYIDFKIFYNLDVNYCFRVICKNILKGKVEYGIHQDHITNAGPLNFLRRCLCFIKVLDS